MPSDLGRSHCAAIAARVRQQTRFYDRKSKHLRFDGGRIFLHRGFDSRGTAAIEKQTKQRGDAGAEIFVALRADYDEATAERIFMTVTRSPRRPGRRIHCSALYADSLSCSAARFSRTGTELAAAAPTLAKT